MTVNESKVFSIEASPKEVLDVLADVESLPDWWDGYKSIEVLERDESNRPLRTKASLKSGTMADEQVLVYTWHDDGVSWTLEKSKLQRAQEVRYTLTPDGDGTTVKFDVLLEPMVRLPAFLMKRGTEMLMKTATEDLRGQVLKGKSGR
ncbi:SRPBCC family protein [Mycolicibacterium peregrinum]|uniref:SRPBCC family protein n=1 Tax=Mycolicibacterium TaxID=1866885 RepID=UPI003AAB1337